ncbi:hypothetical protein AMS66_03080 [Paenibacillus xylanivorans]|uniref:Uncharacterized protein n=1 Tax=Paenibacillus xylanivorans TaxID=1705561 RepID=A0A0M9BS35_9BACL|nr:hypothetical protein AMS66_03080 [Paenibacillus xylanivorans]
MTGVDPTTLTAANKALLTQEALLAGIQYSFYIALGINIVALILVFFIKHAEVSDERFETSKNQQGKTETKTAVN